MYPIQLVNPDGSTVRIRYDVPKQYVKVKIVQTFCKDFKWNQFFRIYKFPTFQLPLDFDNLSADMQRKVKLMRLPKDTTKKAKKVTVAFDPMKYAKKW